MFKDQDVVLINLVILMILKKRIPLTSNIFMKLMEINLNWLGMDVKNGMILQNQRLLEEEKLLKAANLSRDLIKITPFVLCLCKLIEEMIVEKLPATVFHRLHSTQVVVLLDHVVASVRQTKLWLKLSRSSQMLLLLI